MPQPKPKVSTNYKAKRAAAVEKAREESPCPNCDGHLQYLIETDQNKCPKCGHSDKALGYPAHWVKGQLLNVSNNGAGVFMLIPLEEAFDYDHPERAKFFDNSHDCQAFVSWWYARDNHDPRA